MGEAVSQLEGLAKSPTAKWFSASGIKALFERLRYFGNGTTQKISGPSQYVLEAALEGVTEEILIEPVSGVLYQGVKLPIVAEPARGITITDVQGRIKTVSGLSKEQAYFRVDRALEHARKIYKLQIRRLGVTLYDGLQLIAELSIGGKTVTILKPEYSWVVQQIVRSANLGYRINLSVQK